VPVAASPAETLKLGPDGLDLKQHLADTERTLLLQALERSGWVVARAAQLLGLQRTTLVEKMRKFELQRDSAPSDS
jgi:sigma-54 specific flagellar transcriptional regulator A